MRRLGVVLAGGASSRFGSDKAAALLMGKPLLQHVCERAASQVDKLVINRNDRPLPALPTECEVMRDDWPGEGPLAGIVKALEFAEALGFSQMASFPCDTPIFPSDLISRLGDQLVLADADCCIAKRDDREQRALALWNVSCAAALKARFLSGMRRLGDVPDVITTTTANFENGLMNINTPCDLDIAARWLAANTSP